MTGLLKGKVVVISGVGPALGTTLAHRCARDGVELVLWQCKRRHTSGGNP